MKYLLVALTLFGTTAFADTRCKTGKHNFNLSEKFGISEFRMQDDGGFYVRVFGVEYANIRFRLSELIVYPDSIEILNIPILGRKTIPFDLEDESNESTRIYCKPKY